METADGELDEDCDGAVDEGLVPALSFNPGIAYDSGREIYGISYIDVGPDGYHVYLAQTDADGAPLAPPFRVSSRARRGAGFANPVVFDGERFALMIRGEDDGFELHRVTPAGGGVASPQVITEAGFIPRSFLYDGNQYIFLYVRSDHPRDGIFRLARWRPGHAVTDVPVLVENLPSSAVNHSYALTDGTVALIWVSGRDSSVRFARLATDGTPLTEEIVLARYDAGSEVGQISIAVHPGGGFWVAHGQPDVSASVQRLTSDGRPTPPLHELLYGHGPASVMRVSETGEARLFRWRDFTVAELLLVDTDVHAVEMASRPLGAAILGEIVIDSSGATAIAYQDFAVSGRTEIFFARVQESTLVVEPRQISPD